MPYVARWDAEECVIVVGGTVRPEEFGGFIAAIHRAVQQGAVDEQHGAKLATARSVCPANWLRPFRWLIDQIEEPGNFVRAVKLWRAVADASLIDAKKMVEDVRDVRRPPPTGYEYGDVPPDALSFLPSEALGL